MSGDRGIVKLRGFSFEDGHHQYYFDLLERSLEGIGFSLELQVNSNVPQKRIEYILDTSDESYFHIFLRTDERDRRWHTVSQGLTNSLIGQRVLFIPAGMQRLYEDVKTLDDFRNLGLTGGFGAGWYDIEIWRNNDLDYFTKSGEWRSLYAMVASRDRGVDYFSRGVVEILGEYPLVSGLDIEANLLLVYDRDFHFYLSGAAGEIYGSVIEEALHYARENGLIDELVREYWGESFRKLGIDERSVIKLETPNK